MNSLVPRASYVDETIAHSLDVMQRAAFIEHVDSSLREPIKLMLERAVFLRPRGGKLTLPAKYEDENAYPITALRAGESIALGFMRPTPFAIECARDAVRENQQLNQLEDGILDFILSDMEKSMPKEGIWFNLDERLVGKVLKTSFDFSLYDKAYALVGRSVVGLFQEPGYSRHPFCGTLIHELAHVNFNEIYTFEKDQDIRSGEFTYKQAYDELRAHHIAAAAIMVCDECEPMGNYRDNSLKVEEIRAATADSTDPFGINENMLRLLNEAGLAEKIIQYTGE
jgi:hypothetical protein